MQYSVVIINYKTRKMTADCVRSVISLFGGKDVEIILAINEAEDDEVDFFKDTFNDQIKIIANKVNLGFGKACNQAAKIAKGQFLFFLNSDTLIENNFLPIITSIFNSDSRVGIVSPLFKKPSGKEQLYGFGEFPDLFTPIISRIRMILNKDQEKKKVEWVSGAAMIIRKDLFNKLNGFDENFFMYFEDIDICKRTAALGHKVYLCREIQLMHKEGASSRNKKLLKKIYYQSQDYYYKKYYGVLGQILVKLMRWPFRLFKNY